MTGNTPGSLHDFNYEHSGSQGVPLKVLYRTPRKGSNVISKDARPRNCNIKVVLFDMDNTLFDFFEAKLIACSAIINYLEIPVEPIILHNYFLRSNHGFESHEHIRDFLQDNSCFTEVAFNRCCAIYDEEKIIAIKPFPHVVETLTTLRNLGLRLAIVTDAHHDNAIKRLKKAGLEGFFDTVTTIDMHGKAKPSSEPFLYVMKKLGVKAEETMMVGDSIGRDILPAKMLGIFAVHAAFGDRNQKGAENDVADYVIHRFDETIQVLQRIMD